jgi:hypothetical protein
MCDGLIPTCASKRRDIKKFAQELSDISQADCRSLLACQNFIIQQELFGIQAASYVRTNGNFLA